MNANIGKKFFVTLVWYWPKMANMYKTLIHFDRVILKNQFVSNFLSLSLEHLLKMTSVTSYTFQPIKPYNFSEELGSFFYQSLNMRVWRNDATQRQHTVINLKAKWRASQHSDVNNAQQKARNERKKKFSLFINAVKNMNSI